MAMLNNQMVSFKQNTVPLTPGPSEALAGSTAHLASETFCEDFSMVFLHVPILKFPKSSGYPQLSSIFR